MRGARSSATSSRSPRRYTGLYGIVNYDNFVIAPDLIDAGTEMVKGVVERYYWGVTRYTTSNFPSLEARQRVVRARPRTAHLRISGRGPPSFA